MKQKPCKILICSKNNQHLYLISIQVAVETIYVIVQTFIYTIFLYSMIGFDWKADKFLWFYFFILMCFVYFTLYGMMLLALTPSYQIAAIVMSIFLSFWNLFSGFLIPRTVSIMHRLKWVVRTSINLFWVLLVGQCGGHPHCWHNRIWFL